MIKKKKEVNLVCNGYLLPFLLHVLLTVDLARSFLHSGCDEATQPGTIRVCSYEEAFRSRLRPVCAM